VDKLRINPSNITDKKALREVIAAAARKKIPIRIGVNSGSVRARAVDKDYAYVLFQEAKRAVDFFAEQGFRDLVVSIKSSRVRETIAANRYFSEHYDYPLHLGVTATGPKETAIVKSAIGIGVLLEEGIGDTIRVSLTDDSASEVRVAQHILQALEIQYYQPDIISCPVCSRCGADLRAMLEQLRAGLAAAGLLSKRYAHLKIALMGCEVNGPGEAKMADIGLAIGGTYSMIFKRGVAYRKVPTRGAIPRFITEIKKLAGI